MEFINLYRRPLVRLRHSFIVFLGLLIANSAFAAQLPELQDIQAKLPADAQQLLFNSNDFMVQLETNQAQYTKLILWHEPRPEYAQHLPNVAQSLAAAAAGARHDKGLNMRQPGTLIEVWVQGLDQSNPQQPFVVFSGVQTYDGRQDKLFYEPSNQFCQRRQCPGQPAPQGR